MAAAMHVIHSRQSAVALLREETREDHHNLENALNLLSPTLQVGRYADILTVFADVYAPLENALSVALDTKTLNVLDWSSRCKLSLLIDDLNQLGRPWIQPQSTELSVPISNSASALGILYIMEGATLGGQIITKHLLDLPCTPQFPVNFFSGYGTATAANWAIVRSILRDALRTSGDRREAVTSAKALCSVLNEQFSEN